MVVVWGACAHLSAPVERESYLVELLTVAVDILACCLLRVLSCLYGILLCWQAVGVVSHGVEHIVALQALVAGIDIAGDIAERMADMESRT